MSAIHTTPIKDFTHGGIRFCVYRALNGETTATLTCGEVSIQAHTIHTPSDESANAHMLAWAGQVINFAHAVQPSPQLGSTAFTMLVIAGTLLKELTTP